MTTSPPPSLIGARTILSPVSANAAFSSSKTSVSTMSSCEPLSSSLRCSSAIFFDLSFSRIASADCLSICLSKSALSSSRACANSAAIFFACSAAADSIACFSFSSNAALGGGREGELLARRPGAFELRTRFGFGGFEPLLFLGANACLDLDELRVRDRASAPRTLLVSRRDRHVSLQELGPSRSILRANYSRENRISGLDHDGFRCPGGGSLMSQKTRSTIRAIP